MSNDTTIILPRPKKEIIERLQSALQLAIGEFGGGDEDDQEVEDWLDQVWDRIIIEERHYDFFCVGPSMT